MPGCEPANFLARQREATITTITNMHGTRPSDGLDAQRIHGNGMSSWTEGGIVVSTGTVSHAFTQAGVANGSDGAMFTWPALNGCTRGALVQGMAASGAQPIARRGRRT